MIGDLVLLAGLMLVVFLPGYVGLCALWGCVRNMVQGDWESAGLCAVAAGCVAAYLWWLL